MGQAHPVDIHVGKRLRLRRTVMGLNQVALANAIGVTFQQIQKYEKGVNRMGSSRLYQFAKLLAIPVSFFFEGLDEDKSGEVAGLAEGQSPSFQNEDIFSNRETMELVRIYNQIPHPQVRKRLLDTLRAIAETYRDDNSSDALSKSKSSEETIS